MFNDANDKSIIKIKRPAECYEAAVAAGYRIPENESIIRTDSYLAYLYTKNVINKESTGVPQRWPAAESIIAKDPTSSVRYAQDILLERWNGYDAEKIIAESLVWAPIYCKSFNLTAYDLRSYEKSDPFLAEELDKSIDLLIGKTQMNEAWSGPYPLPDFKLMTPIQVVQFLNSYKVSPEYTDEICELAKPYVLKSAYACYLYAKDIMGEPWPYAEPIILRSPRAICEYCIHVKGNWKYGEDALIDFGDAECCVDYACELLEERWEAAEKVIKSDPKQALNYSVNREINLFWDDPALEFEMLKLMSLSGSARYKLHIYATDLAGFEDLESFIENNNSMVSELLKDDDLDLSDLEQE
jgi:hypothetical protein